jgi:hypothetical protein
MSISYGDRAHTSLRSLVATVERELASVGPSEALRGAWDEFVKVLALGPAPELRACPTCNELVMRAATRCSGCWSSLLPV